MPFLLDTNVCSAALKGPPGSRVQTLLLQHLGQLFVSRISCAELFAYGYRTNANQLLRIDRMLGDWKILEFDDECSR